MRNRSCRLYASVKSIVVIKFGQQGLPHAKTLCKNKLAHSPAVGLLWGVRVVAKKRLVEFWVTYPETQEPLKAWHDEAFQANWKSPKDIKDRYPSASFVSNNRIVFNIKGNALDASTVELD